MRSTQASYASFALHIFGAMMGWTVGVIVSSAFGLASTMPKLHVGAVASGMGLSGCITFAVWMVSSHVIFEYDRAGVIMSIWILLVSASLFCFATLTIFIIFWKSRIRAEHFEEHQSLTSKKKFRQLSCLFDDFKCEEINDTKVVIIEPERNGRLTYRELLWELSGNVTLRFFIFFQTLIVFPNIGPVEWNDTPLVADICTVSRYTSFSIKQLGMVDLLYTNKPLTTLLSLVLDKSLAIK